MQIIFADCTAALPPVLKARFDGLVGLHITASSGRSRNAVLKGETPKPLRSHERAQRQAVVRRHPVTGRRCLLCLRVWPKGFH
jgi:hypothetical protein